MKKEEDNKMSFSKKLGLFLLTAWVLCLAGTTAWALWRERKMMPEVETGYPQAGTIVYNCQVEAEVLSKEEASLMVPHTFHLHSRLFQEGTDLGIGTVTSYEMGGDGHYMKIRLKEDGTAGEMLPVEINYVHDYDQVVDNKHIHLNSMGMSSVFVVEEEAGAWGKEYRLREKDVICFPVDISTEQVAILDELEQPIVLKSSKELKGGMKVKLAGEYEK